MSAFKNNNFDSYTPHVLNNTDSVDDNDGDSGDLSKTTAKGNNEKSEETSRNPDAPVDTVPSARDSEIYTEIVREETSDCQAKRTGETSFTVQTTDPSQYEELRA
ncbi:hypothetical protein MAR_020894, partial [Mya arenaria]